MTLGTLGCRAALIGMLVMALLAGACGAHSTRPGPAQTPEHGATTDVVGAPDGVPSIVTPPDCDDTGSCAAGFTVANTFYTRSCGAVRPEVVTEEVLAKGDVNGDDVEVRAIESVDSDVLVAVSIEGGRCSEGEGVLSPWSMAFPEESDDDERGEAICHAAVDEHQARNGCR